jgi:hypothetical protein
LSASAYKYQSAKLKELKKTLDDILERYKENPEQIAELLAFKGQFHSYSMHNTILIYNQNPGATYVASFRDWKKKGYHVLKGQHGIRVRFPIRTELIAIEKDGKTHYKRVADAAPEERQQIEEGTLKTVSRIRFGTGTVFDISQTDCPPEKYPEYFHMGYSSEQHAALYRTIKEYAQQKGIQVLEADLRSISLRGDYLPTPNMIRINDKLNDTEKLSTLTHELGHALLHNNEQTIKYSDEVLELQADSLSIMLQQYCGIELTQSRKRHFVQHYKVCKLQEDFNLEEVLKDVNLAYHNLLKELEPILEQAKIPQKEVKTVLAEKQAKQETSMQAEQVADREKKPVFHDRSDETLDYIKYGIPILTLASDMGFTPKPIGSYYTLKEHDSVRIYPETNSFMQFSSGIGGSTIDFVMRFGNYDKAEAIRLLKERYLGRKLEVLPHVAKPNEAVREPARKEFILPPKAEGTFSRAFAYLTKTRCIDPGIVQQCMKDGLIYEDNKHNVVFVGKDENGNPVYATKRSTLTGSSFKCDVAGARQDVGFYVNHHAEKLYICEAPIDALSIMTLMKQQGKPVEQANYLATGGTGKDAAVYFRLDHNPQIKTVVLANDNDDAGRKANQKIIERLRENYPEIHISCLIPKQGKDMNEYLCMVTNSPKEKALEREVTR